MGIYMKSCSTYLGKSRLGSLVIMWHTSSFGVLLGCNIWCGWILDTDGFLSWHSLYLYILMKRNSGKDNYIITAILQAGASFGSCKNISVPNTSPASNTAGSFTGSVQFSRSASPVHYPNSMLIFLFYFLLVVLLQLW